MSTGGKKDDPAVAKRPKPATPPGGASPGVRRWVRIVASLVLMWHVGIMFLSPLAYSTKPSPPVVSLVQHWGLRWYSDPLFLNQGYGFFSPDPGFASTLVAYKVYDDKNELVAEGTLPDRDRFWPRLRYHRHKMLADQIEGDVPERTPYLLRGYARHLIRKHNAYRAEVTQVAHNLVPLEDFLGLPLPPSGPLAPGLPEPIPQPREPRRLDDKSTYHDVRTVVQTRADVERIEAARAEARQSAPPTGESIPPGGTL